MLMKQNVNNDVTKDSPAGRAKRPLSTITRATIKAVRLQKALGGGATVRNWGREGRGGTVENGGYNVLSL